MSTPGERSRWERVEALFHGALGIARELRPEYLARECGADSALRNEVEQLLAEHDSRDPGWDDLTTAPPAGPPGEVPCPGLIAAGQVVGRYRVIRLIGAGGMGAVYEASQESPARTVALKLLSVPDLSGHAARRFEHEAQVLAGLRHPGIARVFDAGTLEAAGPVGPRTLSYIAMELVPEARSLTRYADEKGLDWKQRLELFMRICDAVQHAHAKGVIHRDLKPANILVDSAGNPQIIDFGIARATGSDLARTTMATSVGQIIGTIAYMSPEQCGGDPHEIDTRSDVYALGVILYELLAGRMPYGVERKLLHEAVRVIREDEPTRLSTVNRLFRGDVETIVGKALAKEKDRRYQTASDLAGDLRRYLHDEPINARPPSAGYQLAKFARRNKTLVGSAATILVVLVAALAATTRLYLSADAARGREARQKTAAQNAQADAERARDAATREAAKATAAVDFLVNMLTSADPKRAEGERLTVRQVLDAAAVNVTETLADKPEVRATVELALARTYAAIGNMRKAAEHYARQIELIIPIEGERSQVAAASRQQRGFLLWQLGEMDEARSEIQKAIDSLDEGTPERARILCQALQRMARLDYTAGRFDAALVLLRRAVAIGEAHLPQTRDALGQAEEILAATLLEQGKAEESLPHFRRSIEISEEVNGPEHVFTAGSRANAAKAYMAVGDLDEADALLTDAMRVILKVLGPEHRNASAMKVLIGELRARQGRFDEGTVLLGEALAGLRAFHGRPAPDVFDAACKLAHGFRYWGKRDEAIAAYREALQVGVEALTLENPYVVDIALTLAWFLGQRATAGDAAESSEILDRVAGALGVRADAPNRDALRLKAGRARCLELQGHVGEADALWLAAWDLFESAGAWTVDDRGLFIDDYAAFLERSGRSADAAAWRAKKPGAPAGG